MGTLKYQAKLGMGGSTLFQNMMFSMIASMGLYLVAWRNMDQARDRFAPDNHGDIFDFIVVGAGSAGALVASRLSKNHSVLLLEAGGENHPFQIIPSLSPVMMNYPQTDWQYYTVPQSNGFFASNHQEGLLSAGLGLGGSSSLGFMMHNRGHPKDYDKWGMLVNDSDWTYDSLIPFFKKNENFVGDYASGLKTDLHGSYGEINVQQDPDFSTLGETYLEAAKEMGFNITDLNGRFTEGFDYMYHPVRRGQRLSTYEAFLVPTRHRQNLVIRKYALVTKVLFKKDDESNEAIGVEYMRHGKRMIAYAKKEVIVSAGTIGSAKLLMQSGIGPRVDLESVKVDVRKDLPRVGKNLQDHMMLFLGPFFINDTLSIDIDNDIKFPDLMNFLANGHGPFTTSGNTAQGLFASSLAKEAGESEWPDTHLSIFTAGVCSMCDSIMARAYNLKEDVVKAFYEHAKGKQSFMQLISVGRPHARGTVKLRSANGRVPPAIEPNYLDNEHDVKVMIEGIKRAINLVENTTAFQSIGGRLSDEKFPGCHEEEFRSDAYWECFVRQYAVSYYDLVGSCSMGRNEDEGVVDTQLRVFGTKRLRVVDASVIPVIPVANTNWPTIMVGEKASNLIHIYWKNVEIVENNSNNSTGNSTYENDNHLHTQEDNEIRDQYERLDKEVIEDVDLRSLPVKTGVNGNEKKQ